MTRQSPSPWSAMRRKRRRLRGIAHILLLVVVVVVLILLLSKPTGLSEGQNVEAAMKLRTEPITSVPPDTKYNQRQRLLVRGQLVYNRYCVGCHGINGDGKGPASVRLLVQPRDFTRGIYKFRSTDSGSLPMERDLHRTITRGLARVSMPAFPLMPEQDKLAVIQYVKSFYANWDKEKDRRVIIPVPNAPPDLDHADRIGRGRIVYLSMGCGNCHGGDGAGQNATRYELIDEWGNTVRPFNFTRGRLKSGDDPEDIYRAFHTGIRGSNMPAFAGETLAFASPQVALNAEVQKRFYVEGEPKSLEKFTAQFPADPTSLSPLERLKLAENNSWDLVAYVLSLRKGGGKPTAKPPKQPAGQPTKPDDEDY